MLVIDIGHSRQGDKGSYNAALKLYEWDWNKQAADELVKAFGPKAKIVERTEGITKLVRDINACKPAFCISLHCNSFINPASSGTEVLYYHKSEKSKAAAELMQKKLVNALHLPDRGVKPKTAQDRGGWQLQNVASPIILLEPFFLSNPLDVAKVKSVYPLYIKAMVEGIKEIMENITK